MRSIFKGPLQQLAALSFCLLLTACGGSDSPASEPVSERPPVTPTPLPPVGGTPVELGVMVNFGYNPLAAGAVLRTSSVQNFAVGNGSANYRFPRSGETISGNLTIALDVADPDGLARVLVGFNGSEQALALCSSDCGLTFSKTVTGINPRDFGLSPGSIRLELWLEDLLGNRVLFDARDIEWLPEPVVGVNTTRAGTGLQVSWSANTNARRYNLYVAEQPGLTPANALSKAGGRQFLGLSQTNFSIPAINAATRYFVLITGVDASGESLYSEEHIVQPAGAPQFSLPVASDDVFSLNEDSVLTGELLLNDSHPDGTSFNLDQQPVRPPENGTVILNANGSFTYQPAENFFGNDSFIYQITDARQLTAQALVSLTVSPVNDAPVLQNDSYSLDKNTSLTVAAPGVLANDSDIDGATLSVDSAPLTAPAHGTLQLRSDGSFSYSPVTNYAGEDFFVYQVSDGQGGQTQARVDLRIEMTNAAPVAQNDSYQLNEDERLTVSVQTGILANDSDPDADVISLVTELVSPVANGQLILAPDGSFQYIPNQDFFGTDSFSYQIKDPAGLTSTATVLLQVAAQNDPPVIQASSYSVDQDGVLSVEAPGLLVHSSDIDDTKLSLVVNPVASPGKGLLTLSDDGAFIYQPNAGVSGSDSFSYQVKDDSGAVATGVAVISIIAAPPAPVLADRSLQIQDIQSAGAVLAQLEVESSAPGTSISFSLLAGDARGLFNLSSTGVLSVADAEALAEAGGRVVTLRVQALDSNGRSAQANLTISILSTGVTASNDSYQTAEDLPLNSTVSVLGNDQDSSGQGLTAALVNAPVHGSVSLSSNGQFQYSPAPNFYGQDSFVYSASNGIRSAQATVTIAVTAVNDAPVLQDESFSISAAATENALVGQLNWQDVENDQSYSFAILSGNSEQAFAISAQGQLIVANTQALRALNASSSSLLVQITDSAGASDSAIVTVQVLSATPVAQADAYSLNQGALLQVDAASGVLANDTDPTAAGLIVTLVSGPASGQLTLNPDGSFSYQAPVSFFGLDSFVYRASNAAQSAEATVTLEVKEDIPFLQANSDSYSLLEDSLLTVPVTSSLLANDVIRSADPAINVELVQGPSSGSLSLNSNGTFSYQPAPNASGSFVFSYRITQGRHSSAVAEVQLNVNPVNDAPELQDTTVTISDSYVNAQNVVTLSLTDIDPGSYSFEILSGNTGGVFEVTSTGIVRIANASALSAGSYSLIVRVIENNDVNLSDTASVTITVNSSLQANPDTYTLNEDNVLNVQAADSVLQNDQLRPSIAASVSLIQAPASGTLNLNTNGTFSYQPAPDVFGTYSFIYRVTQGSASSDAAVQLVITSVNDAPELQDTTVTISDSYVNAQNVLTLSLTDIDPGSYSFEILSGNTGGVFEVTSAGTIRIANASELSAGSYSLLVRVTEDNNESLRDTATVLVTVTSALKANADSYTLDEDTTLTVSSVNSLLQNDNYNANESVSVSLVTAPVTGTLTLNTDGTFTYIPAINAYGTYYFTYRLTQGSTISEAQVELNITSVNDAPLLSDASASITKPYVNLQDVVSLTVLDPDPGIYQFQIISGDVDNAFSVSSDGMIQVANATVLNATTTSTYNLMVQVTEDDDSALTGTATVTINLTAATSGDVTDVEHDTTFANGGEFNTQMMLSGEYNDPVEIIPLSDGRSLIVGTVYSTASQELYVVRLLANGSVDTSFGNNGVFRGSILSVTETEEAVAAVLTPAGDLVILANYTDSEGSGFFLIRLNSAGTLDSTFGGNAGHIICPDPQCELNASATDLILTNAGKYMVSGTRVNQIADPDQNEAFLYQFIDSGYFIGVSGVFGTVNRFDLVRQDSLGRFYAIGQSTTGHVVVARYLSDLTLDTPDFGPGYFQYSFGLQGSTALDAVVYDNGSSEDLYVVGSATEAGAPVTTDGLFFKVNGLNGSLDSSFGSAGLFRVNGSGNNPLRYRAISHGPAGFYILTSTETASDDLLSVSKHSLTGLFEDDEPLASDGEIKPVGLHYGDSSLWLLGQLTNPAYGAVGTVSFNWVAKRQASTLLAEPSFSADGQRWFNAGFGNDVLSGTKKLTLGDQVHKTLFYGYSYSSVNGFYEQAYIGRLTASGELDLSFGNHGVVLVSDDQLTTMRVETVLEAPDNKVYVAGNGIESLLQIGYVLRLNQQGSVDPAFGNGVVDFIPAHLGSYDAATVRQLQLDSTGQLLIGAEYSQGSSNIDVALARLDPLDGTLDSSFGSAGFVKFDLIDSLGNYKAQLDKMVLDPVDHSIVIAGQFRPAAESMLYIARYDADGELMNSSNHPSASFGTSGAGYSLINLSNDSSYTESLNGLVFDEGRRLVLAMASAFEGARTQYVHRLIMDGTADPYFNSGQPRPYTSFSNSVTVDLRITDIRIDDNDRLVMVGKTGSNAWVGRVLMDGSGTQPGRWDPAFEFNSAIAGAHVFTGFGFSSDLTMELTEQNKLLLGWSKFVASEFWLTFSQFELYEYDPNFI